MKKLKAMKKAIVGLLASAMALGVFPSNVFATESYEEQISYDLKIIYMSEEEAMAAFNTLVRSSRQFGGSSRLALVSSNLGIAPLFGDSGGNTFLGSISNGSHVIIADLPRPGQLVQLLSPQGWTMAEHLIILAGPTSASVE